VKGIVFEGERKLVPAELPMPKDPGPGEVLIKPSYVGLCYSEKHHFESPYPTKITQNPTGMIWGHEFAGAVEAVGPGVSGLAAGDRVTIDPRFRCGTCPMCRAGLITSCESAGWIGLSRGNGGLAEYTLVPDYMCYVLPPGVSDLQAATVEATTVGTRAVRRSGLSVGDNVVFFGAEDYNLGALQFARLAGASQRIVVDPYPVRRAAAERVGATLTVNPREEDPLIAIRDLMPRGADILFVALEDYVPEASMYLRQAFDAVRVQGEVVINRVYSPTAWENVMTVVPLLKEVRITHYGVFYGEEPQLGGRARGDYQLTIDRLASGDLIPDAYDPRIVEFWSLDSPDDLAEIFDGLPESAAKVLYRVHGQPSQSRGAQEGT
jgi:(R,R)-butanediol dehydrogenase/meso-butanediol dehydrogenase/diacetyl reductase